MSDRRLRDDVREIYLSREPPPATLERLVAMEGAARRQRWLGMRPPAPPLLKAAAAVLLAAGLWTVLADRDADALARPIADEIAMNHNKRLDAEFETVSYAELRRTMNRLDFSLIEPRRASEDGLRLVGARYCSIRGQLAAQLRLETDDGKRVTLYQTALTGALEGLETQVRAGGLAIELWQEDGVFLGMARGP